MQRAAYVLISVLLFVASVSGQNGATKSRGRKLQPHRIALASGKTFTLNLPAGFGITVAAQGLSRARFMALSPDHRLFVTDLYNRTDNKKGAVYLLDDFDPKAGRFGKVKTWLTKLRNPNSLAFYTDANQQHWLYLALTDKLVRYKYTPGEDQPSAEPETLATFPDYGLNYKYGGWHLTRTVVIGGNGKVYVAVGSSCNACAETEEVRAAVLEMDADGKNQRIFAKGLRNAVGLKWFDGRLFATNMGADHLGDDRPGDTMYIVTENTNYGWPSCFQWRAKVYPDNRYAALPTSVSCREVPRAYAEFEAHGSPLGMEYFGADEADHELRDSFLVALHGSGFVRIGHGYSVVSVRKDAPPQAFMTGFLQNRKINGRPVDVLKFGDGLLLTDDYAGVVYYVFHEK